ncbi:MAG TPA: YkgJ family cysteine cluster protein [archaeon]|nr:YkgJ family cysteine cluster protein [archaeon]
MVMLNFECQRCGECCKRYYIISLPNEVAAQAESRGLTVKEFKERHMQLFLQLFPYSNDDSKPCISSALIPKRILEQITGRTGDVPEFFLALPMLVFKRREDGACTFYDNANSACTLYSTRPAECRMFPFISDKKVENYSKLYPFCEGLKHKSADRSYVDLSFLHFSVVSRYFGEVKEKGFSQIWGEWPNEGVCLYTDKLLGPIAEKEFFGAIGPYK